MTDREFIDKVSAMYEGRTVFSRTLVQELCVRLERHLNVESVTERIRVAYWKVLMEPPFTNFFERMANAYIEDEYH